jgi:hypothetical protein
MADSRRKTGRKRTAGNYESKSSTQTSRFNPSKDNLSVNLGYSVSVFQRVVLTDYFAGQRKHLACGLHASVIGDIDLLAWLAMVGELNFT